MNELDSWTCQRVVLLQYNENPKNTSDKQLNGPIGMMLNQELKITGGSATQKWLFQIDVFSRRNCCTSIFFLIQ